MKKRVLLIFVLVVVAIISACEVNTPVTNDTQATEETAEAEQTEATETAEETTVTGEATIIHLNDDNYHENVDNATGLYFVDFWAEWCGPCQLLGPILEEISAEEGITIYKVDVDECYSTAAEFSITGIPMVYLYKDGEIVDSMMGAGYKQIYLDMLEKHK